MKDNENTFILTLSGPAQVGKSTVKKLIIEKLEKLGIPTGEFSFAQPIYDICSLITGTDARTLNKEDVWFGGKSGRQCLQDIGMYFRENFSEGIWVNPAMKKVRNKYGEAQTFTVVIGDDTRFNNEAERIKEEGGLMFALVRDGQEIIKESGHISERALDKVKYGIKNVNNENGNPSAAADYIVSRILENVDADILPIDSGECEFNNVEE